MRSAGGWHGSGFCSQRHFCRNYCARVNWRDAGLGQGVAAASGDAKSLCVCILARIHQHFRAGFDPVRISDSANAGDRTGVRRRASAHGGDVFLLRRAQGRRSLANAGDHGRVQPRGHGAYFHSVTAQPDWGRDGAGRLFAAGSRRVRDVPFGESRYCQSPAQRAAGLGKLWPGERAAEAGLRSDEFCERVRVLHTGHFQRRDDAFDSAVMAAAGLREI